MTGSGDSRGAAMLDFIRRLYPICRSITGDGVRQTLRLIGELVPLEVREVASSTRVLDWVVPDEWNIRDAYIRRAGGEKVVDFTASNLHVVSYSEPVRRTMSLEELRPHLHSLPERPDWTPYRTSYYERGWGFCLSHRALEALPKSEYEVCIDSTLQPGHLTYAEHVVPGESDDEVLVSCHVCHPSLCNDNLSGIAVAVWLAQALAGAPRRRLSYRFLFVPGTIGAVTWLARNESRLSRIAHGVVLTGLGDRGFCRYKVSRRGDATVDRAFRHVLKHGGGRFEILPFTPYGYDERQYCSPGFNLPVGRFMRTPNGEYPEYHTSADDLGFVEAASLADSLEKCLDVFDVLEHDGRFINLSPKGEPQLGRRGVYRGLQGSAALPATEMAMLWVLNLSDGEHTLLDIAERAELPFRVVRAAADVLLTAGLLAAAHARSRRELS